MLPERMEFNPAQDLGSEVSEPGKRGQQANTFALVP